MAADAVLLSIKVETQVDRGSTPGDGWKIVQWLEVENCGVQWLFAHKEVREVFPCRAWASVSKDFTQEKEQELRKNVRSWNEQILESLINDGCFPNLETLGLILRHLHGDTWVEADNDSSKYELRRTPTSS
ncbi:hypothetical protein PIB30_056688 [Stylosanthes scabra]|uniref:Uncharacterized protein n=1 Tax=Stylosanthes scabra TaxID=79078 RepID=A0ABU6QJ22_9FABA|nr:hypothetical protein [Stylosanthes scabra]